MAHYKVIENGIEKIVSYSQEEQTIIGEEIAKIFEMKHSKDLSTGKTRKDRYSMTWGDKTAYGLVETLVRVAEMVTNKETIKS